MRELEELLEEASCYDEYDIDPDLTARYRDELLEEYENSNNMDGDYITESVLYRYSYLNSLSVPELENLLKYETKKFKSNNRLGLVSSGVALTSGLVGLGMEHQKNKYRRANTDILTSNLSNHDKILSITNNAEGIMKLTKRQNNNLRRINNYALIGAGTGLSQSIIPFRNVKRIRKVIKDKTSEESKEKEK